MIVLALSWSGLAQAQGVSARFGNLTAIYRADFEARVEVDDPVGAVAAVEVLMRPQREIGEEEPWLTAKAQLEKPGWWLGTFTSTTVWKGAEPRYLEVKARILGRRGGILIELGVLEPLLVEVITKPEAVARARLFSRYNEPEEEAAFTLIGYVGLEGRAGSSARGRLYIGAGGALSARTELLAFVSVGPAFSKPALLQSSGPLTLGFDLAFRLYTRAPQNHSWTLFLEPFGTADLRLPGVDVGAGLRVGAGLMVGDEVALEASLGGAGLAFRVADPDGNPVEGGFSGGLRLAIRLGGGSTEP